MSTLIINGVTMQAKVGERVLNVARRNAAHIGFACDNAGVCQGCRCSVLRGEEHLSPPSEAEKAWISADRLAAGERLACQTVVRSHGEVHVLSRAEELRLLIMGIVAPPHGESRLNPIAPLASILLQTSIDQVTQFPGNIVTSIKRVGFVRFAFPVLDRERLLHDTQRVVQRMTNRSVPIRSVRKQATAIPILQITTEEEPQAR